MIRCRRGRLPEFLNLRVCGSRVLAVPGRGFLDGHLESALCRLASFDTEETMRKKPAGQLGAYPMAAADAAAK